MVSVAKNLHLTQPKRALKLVPSTDPTQTPQSLTSHLTSEQVDCLRRCAKGNTLRFEAVEIVSALIAGGYAQRSISGVVTLTAKGRHYLKTNAR
jgi:hypothetical protein